MDAQAPEARPIFGDAVKNPEPVSGGAPAPTDAAHDKAAAGDVCKCKHKREHHRDGHGCFVMSNLDAPTLAGRFCKCKAFRLAREAVPDGAAKSEVNRATGTPTGHSDAASAPSGSMTVPDLDALRALKPSTALPWHMGDRGIGFEVHGIREDLAECMYVAFDGRPDCPNPNDGFRETMTRADAAYIVAAANALPSLLERMATLEALNTTLSTERDKAMRVLQETRQRWAETRVERDGLADIIGRQPMRCPGCDLRWDRDDKASGVVCPHCNWPDEAHRLCECGHGRSEHRLSLICTASDGKLQSGATVACPCSEFSSEYVGETIPSVTVPQRGEG